MTRQHRPSNDLAERRARLRRGISGEWIAVGLLSAKGYRILARRLRTPFGEIDIIAMRGKRIAFVEVKRRGTIEDAEAALTPAQGRRIGDAAEWWIGRYPRYRDHEMGLDAVLVVPRTWPRHIPNALG